MISGMPRGAQGCSGVISGMPRRCPAALTSLTWHSPALLYPSTLGMEGSLCRVALVAPGCVEQGRRSRFGGSGEERCCWQHGSRAPARVPVPGALSSVSRCCNWETCLPGALQGWGCRDGKGLAVPTPSRSCRSQILGQRSELEPCCRNNGIPGGFP